MSRFAGFLFLVVALVLIAGAGFAGSILLPVTFIPQCPPGDWADTMNCGETSLLMAGASINGYDPKPVSILEADNFLGLDCNGGGGIGCAQIISVGKMYFGLNLTAVHWTLAQVKAEVAAGRPVIVGVTAGLLKTRVYPYAGAHWMLVVGYDDAKIAADKTKGVIYVNDPGTTRGANFAYPAKDFEAAFNNDSARSQNGINVVSGFVDPIIVEGTADADFSSWTIVDFLKLTKVVVYLFTAAPLPSNSAVFYLNGKALGAPFCYTADGPGRENINMNGAYVFPRNSPASTVTYYQTVFSPKLLVYGKNLFQLKMLRSDVGRSHPLCFCPVFRHL